MAAGEIQNETNILGKMCSPVQNGEQRSTESWRHHLFIRYTADNAEESEEGSVKMFSVGNV